MFWVSVKAESVEVRPNLKKEENIMKDTELGKTDLSNEQKKIWYLDFFNPITYIAELRKLEHVNSINACLLMGRFEILFNQNPDYFCKYKKPCAWQDKLEGLSWREELGISRTQLDSAFNEIVSSHQTKEEYLLAEDKFKGKYYCSYVDAADYNKTYYFRNNELVDKCIEQLIENTLNSKANLDLEENTNNLEYRFKKIRS